MERCFVCNRKLDTHTEEAVSQTEEATTQTEGASKEFVRCTICSDFVACTKCRTEAYDRHMRMFHHHLSTMSFEIPEYECCTEEAYLVSCINGNNIIIAITIEIAHM